MDEILGRYSKVYRRIWRDEDFRRLSDRGKLVVLRLMTGPELGAVPGLLAVREAGLADDLGWPLEAFREAFREASRKPMAKADWKAGLVYLPRATKYNRPESPNVVRGWRREWPEIPECPLKWEAFHDLRAFTQGLGKAFREAFREAFGDPSPNQEQEQEQEQDQDPDSTAAPADAGPAAVAEPERAVHDSTKIELLTHTVATTESKTPPGEAVAAGLPRDVASKPTKSRAGRLTWLTPYLEAYATAVVRHNPGAEVDLTRDISGEEIAALARWLGPADRRRPLIEAAELLDEWVRGADRWTKDRGLSLLDFCSRGARAAALRLAAPQSAGATGHGYSNDVWKGRKGGEVEL